MELTFSKLKQKDVINLCDGKNFGKICDLTFNDSDFKVASFLTSGGRGFKFFRQELTVPVKSVVKIGEDAVLVDVEGGGEPPRRKGEKGGRCPPPQPSPAPDRYARDDRRSYDEYE